MDKLGFMELLFSKLWRRNSKKKKKVIREKVHSKNCVFDFSCLPEEGNCPGNATEENECKERTCPSWSTWGSWSDCSASCGKGVRDRVRRCEGPGVRFIESCPGNGREVKECEVGIYC